MKLANLQAKLRKLKLDGCLLDSEDPNFRYYLQEYLMSGKLFIPAKGTPTVFVHRLEDLKHEFSVVPLVEKHIFKEHFSEKTQKIGYNPSFVNARQMYKWRRLFKLYDIEEELEEIRVIKTEKEIEYLKKAAKIADEIMQTFIDNFRFKTEGEIKRFLKAEIAMHGVEQSFEPIVASAKGAAIPHYFGDRLLSEGFLIIDMGVKVNGYCSDITRTFHIGKPDEKAVAIYEKVLKVQKECIRMSKAGVKCSVPYDYAFKILGEKFNHGLGHGVGLKIHELPNLKQDSDEKFKENMVFTVEPGYYDKRKKIGIRIEDDILIRNKKPVILTKTDKELIYF